MNILFTITYFEPYVSGLTVYVSRLSRALVGRGNGVTVLCMRHSDILAEREDLGGVHVVRANPLIAISKGFLSMDWWIQSVKEVQQADVVVVNLPQFEGLVTAILAKIFNKKVISIYHCEVLLPNTFMQQIIQSLLEVSNAGTLALSDKIVAYTKDYADNSKLLKLFSEKVTPIYPPVPTPPDSAATRIKLEKKIGKRDILLGVSARLSYEKGIEFLLEALPLIQKKMMGARIKIAMAGPMDPVGESSYKEKIIKLVEKYKSDVVFLGSLSQKEIGAFYRLLDVLVLPSINSTEAFGMVQVEAMLCGVPVVATDLPGVRVPIQKTGMGIVVPTQDAQALADAIERIFNNKKEYVKTSQRIRQEFSMEKTIDVFEKEILF